MQVSRCDHCERDIEALYYISCRVHSCHDREIGFYTSDYLFPYLPGDKRGRYGNFELCIDCINEFTGNALKEMQETKGISLSIVKHLFKKLKWKLEK